MIPAMDEVGKLFEEEEYFVPELLLSAEPCGVHLMCSGHS